ncbi:hypothetical protein N7448_010396 [Penicillium atrosanguineum]|uniref:uncharacterized protein n=1 Tax=Penicillium atrosanguineum TaxID=1132637 RepID=UPI00238680F9|nr:uncharacterized protein N7443_007620 [Penicillium atrosanguineum]KAJ5119727.1 hypothetical protein N7448_010396 [Penicillium atrosanguineum]KAJ5296727.1 hypothetical protein N7443_007620 [Penicillium atrosanguineum]
MGVDHSLSPEAYFSKAFVHACHTGEPSRVQEFLASGRVTAEDLDQGHGAATRQAHAEIVATLFDTGASVSDWAISALHGRSKQDLPVILLDAGADPTARSAGKRYYGEPPSAVAKHQQNPEIKEKLLDLLRSEKLQDE